MEDSILRVESLKKSFGDFEAVKDLSFDVNPCEIFGFLGPNGAGKSTTIKMITGFLKPDAGKVEILGMDPVKNELEVKSVIGVVPEELQMYDRLTGREFLEFAARMYGVEESRSQEIIPHLLGLLDLAPKADNMILDYSYGMQKKLALAGALVHSPKLVFLDEPFTGMDAISVIKVRKLLEKLQSEGVSIFFSSHILELVEKVCDRIAIIDQGRIHAIGTKKELLEGLGAETLEEVFLNLHEGRETGELAVE